MTEHSRIAIVTGASSGIGQSAAIELARAGMGVVVTYNSRPEGAEQTVASIRDLGGRALARQLDIGRTETFADFTSELGTAIEAEWGSPAVHAVINNAGVGGGHNFTDMTEDAFDTYYRVLLRGPYFFTHSLLPLMADGSSIINVSSSSARPGDTTVGFSGYAAMKAALNTASRYLALELSPLGIRVNSISPGPTRTRFGDDAYERFPEIVADLAARTALGRVGEPEDIGTVIAFLASNDSRWITGQDILVAGGYEL